MKILLLYKLVACAITLTAVVAPARADDAGKAAVVRVVTTPDGGIQPQAVSDAKGALHLLYYKGKAEAGDLYYTRRASSGSGFSPAVRVNSRPGSAIAMGTIRGGQIALGKGGRVHVSWNGSGEARPHNPFGGTPMLYARSNADGTAFEPQRNLMTKTSALDGGGTVAADGQGHVYVAWHGKSEDAAEGETGRRMWLARSSDDGETFAPEAPMTDRPTGACGCCGTRAFTDRQSNIYALYRAATEGVARDIDLLTSSDRGEHFRLATVHPWRASMCPMSSESMAEGPKGVVAAWETRGQVYFAPADPDKAKPAPPFSPPGGKGDRKHPAVATNAKGETILVWAEGTGWQKGGDLVWQVFDPSGRPTSGPSRKAGGVPVWGLPTVVAGPDQAFTIIH